ncbi:MAG: cytidylate kinase family protein [Candidatus Micrarchaeaceae archaeon]
MRAILLCGFPAAGKTTVAEIISKKLGIEMIGGTDILKELARERGYKPIGINWWDTPDGIKFLRERESDTSFDVEVDKRLTERAKAGNVVITSYTLPWLANDCFKVWLDASIETRAARMANRDNLNIDEATKIIKVRDRENTQLYEVLYGIHFGTDISPFDLVLDVNKISPEEASEKIIDAFRASENGAKGE